MNKLKIICFLPLLLFVETAFASKQDSTDYFQSVKKNFLEIDILSNEYISPFESSYKFIPVSLVYQRMIIGRRICWQFSVGLSTFRSRYVVQLHPTVYEAPWAICTPVGFLMRFSYRRNGFWFGGFFSPAFVRQEYKVGGGSSGPGSIYVRDFDYQVELNLCYRFQSKSGRLIGKLSYTPKIFRSVIKRDYDGYKWDLFPLWFGLSIGGAW